MQPDNSSLRIELSRDTAQLLRADEVDSVYYQVLGTDGKLLSGDADIPPPEYDPASGNEVKLRDDEVHNDNVRIAYQWVLEHGPEGPVRAQTVVVAGDSAGGNLTLSLVAWVRDTGLRAPDAAVALSPLTDATLVSPSFKGHVKTDALL